MALDEVQALLGGPPHDDTTGPVKMDGGGWLAVGAYAHVRHAEPTDTQYRVWKSDEVLVGLSFDESGHVSRIDRVRVCREEQSLRDMVRRWLGL